MIGLTTGSAWFPHHNHAWLAVNGESQKWTFSLVGICQNRLQRRNGLLYKGGNSRSPDIPAEVTLAGERWPPLWFLWHSCHFRLKSAWNHLNSWILPEWRRKQWVSLWGTLSVIKFDLITFLYGRVMIKVHSALTDLQQPFWNQKTGDIGVPRRQFVALWFVVFLLMAFNYVLLTHLSFFWKSGRWIMEQFYLSVFTGVAKAKICKVSSQLLKAAALNLVLTSERSDFPCNYSSGFLI